MKKLITVIDPMTDDIYKEAQCFVEKRVIIDLITQSQKGKSYNI
jgi:hypothetical protein